MSAVRSTVHSSFAVERGYRASPAKVFAAWSDARAKAQWFHGPNERSREALQLDFRVGGKEHASGVAQDGTTHSYDATYLDIVPGERLILAYWMELNKRPISTSLMIVEFFPDGAGTKLRLTEHDTFLDGYDDAGSRKEGTQWLLQQLGKALGV